jgi:hypothetical protein
MASASTDDPPAPLMPDVIGVGGAPDEGVPDIGPCPFTVMADVAFCLFVGCACRLGIFSEFFMIRNMASRRDISRQGGSTVLLVDRQSAVSLRSPDALVTAGDRRAQAKRGRPTTDCNVPSWQALHELARARPRWRATDGWSDDEPPLIEAHPDLSLAPGEMSHSEHEPVTVLGVEVSDIDETRRTIQIMRAACAFFSDQNVAACLAALPLSLAPAIACLAMLDERASRALVHEFLSGSLGPHRASVRAAWAVRERLGIVGPASPA